MNQYFRNYKAKEELLKQREEETLRNYKPGNYRTPDGYTADIAIFTIVFDKQSNEADLKIMLIQRAEWDNEGNGNIDALKWALPGGFVMPTESAKSAAKRELFEETGVDGLQLRPFGTYDTPGRDPRGWIITHGFYAVVPERCLAARQAMDDACNVELFSVKEVFDLPLAFDHHLVIQDALQQLEKDLLQTTIARAFLQEAFTLAELRAVLLTVTSSKQVVEKSAFYRKVPTLPFIERVVDESGEQQTTMRNSKRPSKLYRFKTHVETASIYY